MAEFLPNKPEMFGHALLSLCLIVGTQSTAMAATGDGKSIRSGSVPAAQDVDQRPGDRGQQVDEARLKGLKRLNPGASGRWLKPRSNHSYDGYHIARAMDAILYTSGSDIQISNVVLDGSRSFLTPDKGRQSLERVNLNNIVASCWKRCVYIRGDSAQWTLRNVTFTGRDPVTNPGDIPVGIAIKDEAHDIMIDGAEISGFQTQYPEGKYPQGDGISAERGNRNITLRNIFSHDNTDGCFDLKSSNTELDNLKAARCNWGYRLWANGHATTLTSEDARKAAIHVPSETTDYVIDKLVMIGSGALVNFSKPGRIQIKSCDLSRWTGKTKKAGEGHVEWGKGC